MVEPVHGLDEMNHSTASARSRAPVAEHSLGRTVLVAALLTVLPLVGMVAVTAAGLSLAFVAGVASGLLVTLARRRRSRERAGRARLAMSRRVGTQ